MANTIADIGAKSVNHGSASRDPTLTPMSVIVRGTDCIVMLTKYCMSFQNASCIEKLLDIKLKVLMLMATHQFEIDRCYKK